MACNMTPDGSYVCVKSDQDLRLFSDQSAAQKIRVQSVWDLGLELK